MSENNITLAGLLFANSNALAGLLFGDKAWKLFMNNFSMLFHTTDLDL